MIIRKLIEYLESWNEDLEMLGDEDEAIMVHNVAIEALEKQESKKVIQHGKEGDDICWFECPVCGYCVTVYWKDETLAYCSECGQKLDWEDKNEGIS